MGGVSRFPAQVVLFFKFEQEALFHVVEFQLRHFVMEPDHAEKHPDIDFGAVIASFLFVPDGTRDVRHCGGNDQDDDDGYDNERNPHDGAPQI